MKKGQRKRPNRVGIWRNCNDGKEIEVHGSYYDLFSIKPLFPIDGEYLERPSIALQESLEASGPWEYVRPLKNHYF